MNNSTILFINPNLIYQSSDRFTTGIVYQPINLAYVVSYFKSKNENIKVLDLFGEQPLKKRFVNNYIWLGKSIEEIEKKLFDDATFFFIYANHISNYPSIINISNYLKKNYPKKIIICLENSQAVTSFSLKEVKNELFENSFDYLLVGDLEKNAFKLVKNLKENLAITNIPGLISKNIENLNLSFQENLDELPFPAWEEFPIKNYWQLGYAHGPISSDRFLSIQTSRGCPYPCGFCIVPEINDRRWRARSPNNILNEIKYFKKIFSVSEFHFEDLNPTVNDKRTRALCTSIIENKLKIKWKIVAGTKVESIKIDTVKLLSESGCKYISISPESGSKKIMNKINKPFNYEHATKVVKEFNKYKIYSQACFVLGYPGENNLDILKSLKMIFNLTMKGIDEIAVFIISPLPGSKIYRELQGMNNLDKLSFSPTWRKDYKILNFWRIIFYFIFITTKLIFYPNKIFKQIRNFFNKKFDTKMEMVPFKAFKLYRNEKKN